MLLENDDDTVLETLLSSNFSPPKAFLIGLGVAGPDLRNKDSH